LETDRLEVDVSDRYAISSRKMKLRETLRWRPHDLSLEIKTTYNVIHIHQCHYPNPLVLIKVNFKVCAVCRKNNAILGSNGPYLYPGVLWNAEWKVLRECQEESQFSIHAYHAHQ
jgi:hypothetical protein